MNQPTADRDPVEQAWHIHGQIVAWTSNVDSKASFALAVESAVAAGVVTLAGDGHRLHGIVGSWENGLFYAGCGLLASAVVFVALVVRPRLRSKHVKTEAPDNYIFFGHLRHWQPDDLAKALDQRDILPVLSRQLINMSRVAWLKHRLLQLSMYSAIIGTSLIGACAAMVG